MLWLGLGTKDTWSGVGKYNVLAEDTCVGHHKSGHVTRSYWKHLVLLKELLHNMTSNLFFFSHSVDIFSTNCFKLKFLHTAPINCKISCLCHISLKHFLITTFEDSIQQGKKKYWKEWYRHLKCKNTCIPCWINNKVHKWNIKSVRPQVRALRHNWIPLTSTSQM